MKQTFVIVCTEIISASIAEGKALQKVWKYNKMTLQHLRTARVRRSLNAFGQFGLCHLHRCQKHTNNSFHDSLLINDGRKFYRNLNIFYNRKPRIFPLVKGISDIEGG